MSSLGNSWLKILKITILRILEISGRPGTLELVNLQCMYNSPIDKPEYLYLQSRSLFLSQVESKVKFFSLRKSSSMNSSSKLQFLQSSVASLKAKHLTQSSTSYKNNEVI